MKPLYALLLLFLLSCGTKNSSTENPYTPTKDTVTAQPRQPFSIPFYAKTDTVRLLPDEDNFIYDKTYFDAVVDNFPILYTDSTLSYYESYKKSGIKKRYKDSLGNTNTIDFSSEMGLDEYAVFYAYFLKRFNTSAEANLRRKKTRAILTAMNGIQEILNCGGTMYPHQYTRLIAQTEYEVYNYYKNKPVLKNIEKSVLKDTEKQKKVFFERCKKLKLNKGCRINGLSKKEEYQIILNHIHDLERLITDDYYLQLLLKNE